MKPDILPPERPTFNPQHAGQGRVAMQDHVEPTGHEITFPRSLSLDDDMTRHATHGLAKSGVDQVLIFQGTFTSAGMASSAAGTFDLSLSIRAVPEPRLRGRSRLNSPCALILASRALGRKGRRISRHCADPAGDVAEDIADLLPVKIEPKVLEASTIPAPNPKGSRLAEAVPGRRIAWVGEHPAGFETCACDPVEMNGLAWDEAEERTLEDLFDAATCGTETMLAECRAPCASEAVFYGALPQPEV